MENKSDGPLDADCICSTNYTAGGLIKAFHRLRAQLAERTDHRRYRASGQRNVGTSLIANMMVPICEMVFIVSYIYVYVYIHIYRYI